MKLYKYSLIAALALSGALSACDDDVKYNAAEPTPGVFFPVGENISKLTIEAVEGSFDIEVARYGSTDEQTYTFATNFSQLTGFSMPATVTFAAEQNSATVTVNYDGATMTPGTYDLKIGFAEGQPVNKFGVTELSIAVTLPEPVEVLPWNDLGECTFTDPFISQGLYPSVPSLSYKVTLQESGETPGLYRLVAPYGSAFADAWAAALGSELGAGNYDADNELYLEIHAEDPEKVYIMPQLIGVTLDEDGEMMGMNVAGLRFNNEVEPAAGDYATLKDGVITLPSRNSLVAFPYSGDTGAYYGNSKGALKMVVFPGVQAGDYSAEVEFMGQFNNVSTGVVSAVATAEFGEDVAAVKAGIVNASSATSLVAAIKSGDYEAVDVDVKDPVVSLPVYTSGTYTIAYVTYDSKGEAQDAGSASFEIEVFANDDAAWTDLGSATVADGWLIGGLYIDEGEDPADYAYTVQAQESVNVPGLYRFKNVWGSSNPLGSMTTTPENTCLYVDASDPECITIVPQSTGWTYGNFGTIYAFNWEGYYIDNGYSKAEVPASRISTTLEDGLFTIVSPLICGTGPAFPSGWGPYGAGDYAAILLPDADENAPAAMAARFNKAANKISEIKNNRTFKSLFKLSYNHGNNGQRSAKESSPYRLNSTMK